MKLILVRSVPGGGKSTFVRTVFPGTFHVENDMYHIRDGKYSFDCRRQDDAIGWCLKTCDTALSAGMDVVVSNTFTKTKYVEAYRKLAMRYGAEFIVYRMRGEFENTHSVPENVLKNMRSGFQDWLGEINVYPNVNQDVSDPCYRPYMFTTLNVGDRISVRFGNDAGNRDATIIDIRQGAFDYLTVSYVENDTGKDGLCMSGDCIKLEGRNA